MRSRPLLRPSDRRAARQRDAWVAFEDGATRRDASSTDTTTRPRAQDVRWILSYQRGEIVALVQRVSELERHLRRRSLVLAIVVAVVTMAGAGLVAYGSPEPLTPGYWKPVARPDRAAVTVSDPQVVSETPPALPTRQEGPPATLVAPEPAKPASTALGSLPVQAPVHVTVSYPPNDKDVEQLAIILVQHLRERGLAADDPVPGSRATGAGITNYFAEDRDGALAVEHLLGGLMGSGRLMARRDGDPLLPPGIVLVAIPAS